MLVKNNEIKTGAAIFMATTKITDEIFITFSTKSLLSTNPEIGTDS